MKFRALFRGSAEEHIDPVEGHGAAPDDRTSRDRAPENVSPGKLPNRQQRSKNRHQDARARYPERNTSDHGRVQKATSWLALLRVLQFVLFR